MSIPTISSNKNSYYDLGPIRKYDIDIICKALSYYESFISTEAQKVELGSNERFFLVSEHNKEIGRAHV